MSVSRISDYVLFPYLQGCTGFKSTWSSAGRLSHILYNARAGCTLKIIETYLVPLHPQSLESFEVSIARLSYKCN
jgi:hypothetical protein